ncbi:MAG: DUF1841 family protein [Armatimonadetes bacterium]|nr:DUF1841 family protein [Armatimonadota bacterium]
MSIVLFEFSNISKSLWNYVLSEICPDPPPKGRNAACPCGSGKKYKLCCWPATGEGPMWDAILDESRQLNIPPPKSDFWDAEHMAEISTHVFRVERLDAMLRNKYRGQLLDLDQGFYDVELAFLADKAPRRDRDYARRALELLGTSGEFDHLVDYQGQLLQLSYWCTNEADWAAALECADRLIGLASAAAAIPEILAGLRREKGDMLIRSGNPAAGLAIQQELAAEEPDEIYNYETFGFTLLRTGDEERAIPLLRKAFELAVELGDSDHIRSIADALDEVGALPEDEYEAAIDKVLVKSEEDEHEIVAAVWDEHPEYAEWFGPDAANAASETEDGVNPRMHVYMHAVVERQIASNNPHEARDALKRLMSEGLSRHEAIHRIAEIISRHLWEMLRSQKKMDVARYRTDLLKLGR